MCCRWACLLFLSPVEHPAETEKERRREREEAERENERERETERKRKKEKEGREHRCDTSSKKELLGEAQQTESDDTKESY